MPKPFIALQPSEAVLVQSASQIYAAYVIAGRVPEGDESAWLKRSIQQAVKIARTVDETVQADREVD